MKRLLIALAALALSLPASAQLPYYTGPTGSNPLNFPAMTQDMNVLVGRINAGVYASPIFPGVVTASAFDGTGTNPFRVGGTTIVDSSRNATFATLTANPPYAGSGVLSPALTFNSPSPIASVQHIFGYGTSSPEFGQLTLKNNSPGVNVFAIENDSTTGFSAITFRGKDSSYTDPTVPFEHMALGWGDGLQFDFLETSRFDGALNPLIPPPKFILQSTGGVDPTGGTNVVCTTNGTTALVCAANSTTNGQLITGTGIPAATTIASGGGTTSIVMSAAATASGSVTLNFSTPVYRQWSRMVLNAWGNIDFTNFDFSQGLSIDPVHDRVGVGNPTPQYRLDVNGTVGNSAGTLNLSSSSTHFVAVQDSVNGNAQFQINNATSGASAQATQLFTTGTANSSFTNALIDASGAPVFRSTLGTAVSAWQFRSPDYKFQTQDGSTTTIEIQPSTNFMFVNGTARFTALTASSGIYLDASKNVTNTAPATLTFNAVTANGVVNLNASNNAATNIGTGTTTSTVTIGNSANSTVLGSTSVTIPLIASDAAQTDATICEDTTNHKLFSGSGTLGICLGTSSLRYKRDWHLTPDGLTQVMALKPGNYFYKKGYGDSGAHEQYGFLAEDVVHVLPKLARLDAQGRPNSVDILGMVPVMVKAMQQQQAEIAELKEEVRLLRHRR